VVDGYAPVVAGLDHDIDQIEATVFSGAVAPTERTYFAELQPYLRDVQDHLLLVKEEVAAQRDLLGTVLEANMAVISVEQTKVSARQDATIEQLTILATVFLPLTFVTGLFGQNFAWLVDRMHGLAAFLVYGIGGLVVPLALLFLWLRLRRPYTSTGAAFHVTEGQRRCKFRVGHAPGDQAEDLKFAGREHGEVRARCAGSGLPRREARDEAAGDGRASRASPERTSRPQAGKAT
jgi:CorA-like Mg2+ transporter protein